MGSKRKLQSVMKWVVSLRLPTFFSLSCVALFVVALECPGQVKQASDEASSLLPRTIGSFRQFGAVRPDTLVAKEGLLNPSIGNSTAPRNFVAAEAEYLSDEGSKHLVEVVRFPRDSDAYSLLTTVAKSLRDVDQPDGIKIGKEVGTAGFAYPGGVAFFKGRTFVRISAASPPAKAPDSLMTLAHLFAERLEKGEADVPVLVKHLPQWEKAQERLIYLAGFNSLKGVVPNQPLLDVVSSEGDADAAIAQYGASHMVIVEFNTPQLAADNDRNIATKLQELRNQGQPVTSAYRRVGNYSVFVFNAPSEQAANGLIDQVQYEQLVQWLGDNPNLIDKAQRDYYQTTAGLLLAVVKASGFSALACLAAGGLVGALLFNRRRIQQRDAQSFSDAGGMLRLNIDELTSQSDRAKLLGPGS